MASSSSPIKPPNGIAKNGDDHDNNDIAAPQESEHSIKGILLIMIGSFCFSIMFLLVKVMTDMNTFTLVFYRSLVQIGISLIDLYKKGTNPLGPNDGRVRFYLVLRAVFGAGAVMAWFFGIQILPLPDAVTLQFTTPPFAAAFAVCMVGERWKRLDVVGAVVCLSGVALIAHPTWLFGSAGESEEEEIIEDDNDMVSPTLKAAAVMVTTAGAAMAGCAYVCVRKIGDAADAVVMVFYYGVLSLPMAAVGSKLYVGDWNVLGDIRHFGVVDYFLLLLVGFAGYGGQWFTNLGLQNETAATATLATSTQIVWTFVFEILFLHEALNVWSLAGTTLILGYMMMVGVLKVMESSSGSRQYYGADMEEGAVDEEGDLLLEPPHSAGGASSPKKNGYGAIQASPATSVASRSSRRERYGAAHVLQWQGSTSW